MFSVVFFDLDHTLVDTRRQYEDGVRIAMQRMYGAQSPEGFVERFTAHSNLLWPLYDARTLTMAELRRERFIRTWRDFGQTVTAQEADRFQAAYTDTFAETMRVFDGILDLVEGLAEGRRLGIVTNGAPDLQQFKLRIAGLDRFFLPEHVIVSERIGRAKPDGAVYAAACAALGVEPGDAVMVGDNYVADVRGARDFGMQAVWFVPDLLATDIDVANDAEEPIFRPAEVLQRILQMEAARQV